MCRNKRPDEPSSQNVTMVNDRKPLRTGVPKGILKYTITVTTLINIHFFTGIQSGSDLIHTFHLVFPSPDV